MTLSPPYPTTIETIDAARNLAGQVRAGFANRPVAAYSAWLITGFGLVQLVGEPSEGFGGIDHGIVSAFDIDDATAVMELDNLAANLSAPDGVSGPISGLVSAALIRWATKLAWRLLIG